MKHKSFPSLDKLSFFFFKWGNKKPITIPKSPGLTALFYLTASNAKPQNYLFRVMES